MRQASVFEVMLELTADPEFRRMMPDFVGYDPRNYHGVAAHRYGGCTREQANSRRQAALVPGQDVVWYG